MSVPSVTSKHHSREYQRNASLRRQQVKRAHALGEAVACWRGGGAIYPGQRFDVGHINEHGGEGLDNLAAEHRHKVDGCCKGNRAHGGTIGASLTNSRHSPTPTVREETTSWKL